MMAGHNHHLENIESDLINFFDDHTTKYLYIGIKYIFMYAKIKLWWEITCKQTFVCRKSFGTMTALMTAKSWLHLIHLDSTPKRNWQSKKYTCIEWKNNSFFSVSSHVSFVFVVWFLQVTRLALLFCKNLMPCWIRLFSHTFIWAFKSIYIVLYSNAPRYLRGRESANLDGTSLPCIKLTAVLYGTLYHHFLRAPSFSR